MSAPAGSSSPGWQPVSTCWPAGWSAGGCDPPICARAPTRWPAGLLRWTAAATSSPDSRWIRRGAAPCRPTRGFVHLDDVPARVVLDLAQRGVALAKEHSSAHGPPASLLDQEVLAVSSGDSSVGIPMRCVFALTAMGFLPQSTAAGLDPGPSPPTRSSGCARCPRGCASTRASARCTAAAATPRWSCADFSREQAQSLPGRFRGLFVCSRLPLSWRVAGVRVARPLRLGRGT